MVLKIFKIIVALIIPPRRWLLPVILAAGVFSGLGVFTLYVSNAFSYLSDDPRTCINCHIMAPEYSTWSRSSHARVTKCNDCHVPQDNIFSHYWFKANDGLRHSFIFTFRLEPQAIKIKEAGQRVVNQNCRRCHENLIQETNIHGQLTNRHCWECHRETPHGRVKSLSAIPYAQVPLLESPVPEWLKNFVKPENNAKEVKLP